MNIIVQVHRGRSRERFFAADAAAHLAPWRTRRCALGCWQVRVDVQPYSIGGRSVTGLVPWRDGLFAWTGRFENLASLAAALGLGAGVSHQTLLAAGCERWGSAILNRLRGRFAAVVISEPRQRVVWRRSEFGLVPSLFDRSSPRAMWIATCFCAAEGRTSPRVNARRLAHYLTRRHDESRADFIVPTERLLPGETLDLELRGEPIYSFEESTPPVTNRPQDSSEAHFSEVRSRLAESLKEALSGARSPVLSLSGGLDSALLLAQWRGLVDAGHRVPAPRTATMSFPGVPATDESRDAAALAREFDAPLQVVELSGSVPLQTLEPYHDYWGYGPCFHAGELHETRFGEAVRQRFGADVLINGVGGEEIYPLGRLQGLEMLVERCRIDPGVAPLRDVVEFVWAGGGSVELVRSWLRRSADARLNPGARRMLRGLFRTTRDLRGISTAGWCSNRALALTDGVGPQTTRLPWRAWGWEYSTRMQWRLQMRAGLRRALPIVSYGVTAAGAGLPSAHLIAEKRAGAWRLPMRRLVAGFVPERARARPKTGLFTPVVWEAFYKRADLIDRLMKFDHLGAHQLVDAEPMNRFWRGFVDARGETTGPLDPPMGGMPFWAPLSAEIWLDAAVRGHTAGLAPPGPEGSA